MFLRVQVGLQWEGEGEEFEFLHKKIYVEKNIFKLKKKQLRLDKL